MSIETNNKLVGKLGSSNIKGSGISVKGETGNGIDKIEKTNSVGLIDTYTIYFTDGNTTTFTITNGKNGIDGVNGTNGENGKSLQFNWNGTQLGIRTEGSTEYTYVDLKGNKGDKGDKGDPGEVTLEQLNTTMSNATKTTQTTEVSEALTIENCAPVSAKLDIKSGKSIQEGEPSPDNIIPIRNVGDNIQLFNKNNVNKLSAYSWSGSTITDGENDFYLLNIPCKANTIYTIQKKAGQRFMLTTTAEIPAIGVQTYGFVQNNTETKLSIETPSNAKYLVIEYYRASSDTLTEQEILDSIKIEMGSIPTPYTPYNCGSADFKVENANTFNINSSDILITLGSSRTINNNVLKISGWGVGYRFKVEKNSIYYIKAKRNVISGDGGQIRFTNNSFNIIHKELGKNNGYFNTGNKEEIGIMFCSGWTATGTCEFSEIILSKIDIDYIPHQEQIKSFPFTEGQVLHKGDYLASDGIHQTKETVVLNGTEEWADWSITSGTNTKAYVFRNFPKAGYFVNQYSGCRYSSTHFLFDESNNYNDDKELLYINNLNAVGIRLNINKAPDLTTFKSYLAEQYANGTPVTIEYELAEEIVIPYTTEQEQAYYELQHLLMYEGYTSIECIDEIKPDIQVEYYFNNEVNKTYCKRIDSLEEKIRLLEKAVSSQSGVSE